jgi:phage tail-like protein
MPVYYPPVGFHFKVVLDGNTNEDTSFQEVSGLSAEIRTEDITEGGENRFVYKVPKTVQYSNLVLKRGLATANSPLVTWCKATIEGGTFNITKKQVEIMLLDEEHNPLMTWKLENAYPIKYNISNFNAERTELVIENIELVYTRFMKV